MSEQKPSRVEQILDLLVEEITDRLRAASMVEPTAAAEPRELTSTDEIGRVEAALEPVPELEDQVAESLPPVVEPELGEPPSAETVAFPVASAGPSHAARLMGRLALWLLIAAVLINIPFNRHGTTLATAMPDTASLVIRDGLVVKEEDDEEIYVYQDGKFRWISSLYAFEHYGYTWGDVHIVPDGYLKRHEIGSPLHVLLKCRESPHIYRMEKEEKRWIRDIDTFVAEGHVWEDVHFVSCQYLRDLPDGETIPPGSGPPPQP